MKNDWCTTARKIRDGAKIKEIFGNQINTNTVEIAINHINVMRDQARVSVMPVATDIFDTLNEN
jgi:hypothetical protein